MFYGTIIRKKLNKTCLSFFSLLYLWYDVTPMCTCTREYSLEFLTGKTNPAPQTYTPCWNRLNVNFPLVKFANARDVRNSRFFTIFWCDEIFRPIFVDVAHTLIT